MMTTTNRTVTAGKRTIDVKPLPINGRPDDFSGAVGGFEFNMTSNKNTLKATEAFDLKLEVSGKGNLKLFKLPKPNLPNVLEIYEPEHSEKVSTNLSGMEVAFQTHILLCQMHKGNIRFQRCLFLTLISIQKPIRRLLQMTWW